ncbi:hypothetical protein PR048_015122 [Dryococelus australis]|uniref:Uncharacterized protein n=1 Tax=Dryococelus australis TaxID=614101 RepID=A0ABQ9HG81_9NEOP|nr:hypothetical protein PR048_015122 [Dryococelus australis]
MWEASLMLQLAGGSVPSASPLHSAAYSLFTTKQLRKQIRVTKLAYEEEVWYCFSPVRNMEVWGNRRRRGSLYAGHSAHQLLGGTICFFSAESIPLLLKSPNFPPPPPFSALPHSSIHPQRITPLGVKLGTHLHTFEWRLRPRSRRRLRNFDGFARRGDDRFCPLFISDARENISSEECGPQRWNAMSRAVLSWSLLAPYAPYRHPAEQRTVVLTYHHEVVAVIEEERGEYFSSEAVLLTDSQRDKRTENLPCRRHRGANPRPSDYRSATLPLNYGQLALPQAPSGSAHHPQLALQEEQSTTYARLPTQGICREWICVEGNDEWRHYADEGLGHGRMLCGKRPLVRVEGRRGLELAAITQPRVRHLFGLLAAATRSRADRPRAELSRRKRSESATLGQLPSTGNTAEICPQGISHHWNLPTSVRGNDFIHVCGQLMPKQHRDSTPPWTLSAAALSQASYSTATLRLTLEGISPFPARDSQLSAYCLMCSMVCFEADIQEFLKTRSRFAPRACVGTHDVVGRVGYIRVSCTLAGLLATHLGESGSIPDGAAPGFSYVGIMLDDATGRQVFSGISRFPLPCIPALIHTQLTLHRNTKAGETGDPRENPPASGVVRHDSHMRKSLGDPGRNQTRFALVGSNTSLVCTADWCPGSQHDCAGCGGKRIFVGKMGWNGRGCGRRVNRTYFIFPEDEKPVTSQLTSSRREINSLTGSPGNRPVRVSPERKGGGGGRQEIPEETRRTSGIARHDSHMRKSGSDPAGGSEMGVLARRRRHIVASFTMAALFPGHNLALRPRAFPWGSLADTWKPPPSSETSWTSQVRNHLSDFDVNTQQGNHRHVRRRGVYRASKDQREAGKEKQSANATRGLKVRTLFHDSCLRKGLMIHLGPCVSYVVEHQENHCPVEVLLDNHVVRRLKQNGNSRQVPMLGFPLELPEVPVSQAVLESKAILVALAWSWGQDERGLESLWSNAGMKGRGKTGDPRANPLTNGIVRHDSQMRKPGNQAGV